MMLKKYETLLLFRSDFTQEDRQNVLDELDKVIGNYSGEVSLVDEWGMKELAYPVEKHTRGYFVRLEYGSPGQAVYELERKIRITEGVLKFMTVKLSDQYQAREEA